MPDRCDTRWMSAAISLAARGEGLTRPNPNVGCLIVTDGRVVGRGWTQAGGRPHAEAMALAGAGDSARGATAYVTLEPCAHASTRGPACADSLIAAGLARVVVATTDPDPRTNGEGIARLRAAGIRVDCGVGEVAARAAMPGWWSRVTRTRPFVTLKLATSLDGAIAMASGESRWITADRARAHAHLLRARCDAILVGRGTFDADRPALDVRLPGLEFRSPVRFVLTSSPLPASASGWTSLARPDAIKDHATVQHLLVEGGAGTAAAFLAGGLVDRLILYRAPILIGGGRPCLGDIGLASLSDAHGQWQLAGARQFGPDRVEIYQRDG
ncbi:bifunctional diaminohydroxyphosphoribosylaminopyrimidine deaminase/5-amino-6-(5-phosphoribosylamino)uracil reductase RibD [Sphingomonas lacunae]|uniref:Riboflavin biosynthesis protein RibD n=1 Tax=Sphingomonas lacunae TaxID=2698828 RepID=A0A6M4ASP3_9SPHN|nr:bifunctional diaminohydroxyphosphoribosylaminopyrimidine deaminase/5-amino-6-(5-phosphoribosylamino)uracil reductase RibD [Sphingomonas lacunae]QJQ31726.1 bifunctional diaminohydroxyphosphoribosylaminopyrimidine deaminase/5-amino-6-(5-phosphoribosylamino)uracil reductase RibD [Sphingomonas lacunae]